MNLVGGGGGHALLYGTDSSTLCNLSLMIYTSWVVVCSTKLQCHAARWSDRCSVVRTLVRSIRFDLSQYPHPPPTFRLNLYPTNTLPSTPLTSYDPSHIGVLLPCVSQLVEQSRQAFLVICPCQLRHQAYLQEAHTFTCA